MNRFAFGRARSWRAWGPRGEFAAAGAGDVNGDGLPDLIVGAWQADPGGNYSAGESYVVFSPVVPCPEDLNGDGVVNVVDLIDLVMSFGPCEDCPADFDGDGIVNVLDLIALIMSFGPCELCGNGVVDPGEDCSNCPQDVQCPPGTECIAGMCESDCPEDVNGDGAVNVLDLIALLLAFGTACP